MSPPVHDDRPSLRLVRALGSNVHAAAVAILRELEAGRGGDHEPLHTFVHRARGSLLHARGRWRAQVANAYAARLDRRWARLGVQVAPDTGAGLEGEAQVWIEARDAHPPPERIGPEEIRTRVAELASRISADLAGASEIQLIGVLKSAVVFTADLARELTVPARIDWVTVSAYGETGVTTDGLLSVDGWEAIRPQGRHVVVVDDALATGSTYAWIRSGLLSRGAESVRLCTLMFAEGYSLSDERPDYFGFSIDWGWPVGYGVDYRERYRNLPGIHQVRLVEGGAG